MHRCGRTARAGRTGWALSFVTQYDVQLVHSIEELIGHQLEEYKLEEAEVLKSITKVGLTGVDRVGVDRLTGSSLGTQVTEGQG